MCDSRVFSCFWAHCIFQQNLKNCCIFCRATFDCSVLSDRSFLINAKHLDILGYGRDQSGSLSYLAETLRSIAEANGGR
jgi:hypothetical protein